MARILDRSLVYALLAPCSLCVGHYFVLYHIMARVHTSHTATQHDEWAS